MRRRRSGWGGSGCWRSGWRCGWGRVGPWTRTIFRDEEISRLADQIFLDLDGCEGVTMIAPSGRALTPDPSPVSPHPLPHRERGSSQRTTLRLLLPLLPGEGGRRGREKRAGVMRANASGPNAEPALLAWSTPCTRSTTVPNSPSRPIASSSAPNSASTTPRRSPAISPISGSPISTARPTSRRRRGARMGMTWSIPRGSARIWGARRGTRGSAGRSARRGWGRCSTSFPITWRSATGATSGGGTCWRTAPPAATPPISTSTGTRRRHGCATPCCCRSWAITMGACWRPAS